MDKKKYVRVDPFTGFPEKDVKEDAPTTSTAGVAATGDDPTVVVRKKKKLYDGRTRVAKKFVERILKQREARKVTEEVELDENYRKLAMKGIGTETKKAAKVGLKTDYYLPKDGNKSFGKITRVTSSGYEITDEKTKKVHKFKFYDPNNDPTSVRNTREEVELDEVLKPKDKKVIDDFVQMNKGTGAQNFTQRGSIVDYEGRSLEKKGGMGAQQIASLESDPKDDYKIKVHAKMDSRSTQSIVNYLKKSAKKYNIKVEETDLEEMPYYRKIYDKIHQMTHPKGYEKIMKMYVDLHKQGHRNPAQAVGQQVSGVEARDVAYYINGLIKKGKLPSALAAEVEPKKFSQKVKEQVDNFGKEYELVENNLKVLQNIVKKKQNQNVRLDNKNVKVDLYTASAIMNVYNAVSRDNKKKMEKMMNGNLNQFLKLQGAAFKLNR